MRSGRVLNRDRLRKLRLKRDWSQADVAERLGVSRSMVSYLESSGRPRHPNRATLERLGALFGVDPRSLLVSAGSLKGLGKRRRALNVCSLCGRVVCE